VKSKAAGQREGKHQRRGGGYGSFTAAAGGTCEGSRMLLAVDIRAE